MNKRTTLALCLLLSAGLAWPLAALAEDDTGASVDADVSDEAGAASRRAAPVERALGVPLSVSASARASATLGHFFRDTTVARNGMASIYGLGVNYRLMPSVSASLSMSYLQYLSAYGGSQRRYEGRFQDMGLSLSHASIFRESWSGINLSGGLSGVIPTSASSQFTGLYTSLSASATLSRGIGPVSLSLTNSFSKNFHRYTSIVADLDRYPIDALARADSPERITETRIALDTGLLTSHSLSHSLSANYRVWSTLSLGLSFGLNHSWTYDNGTITREDEFTNPNARVGRGFRQGMSGGLSASYGFLDYYGVSFSLSTNQSPLTADNRRVRFPFWDFQSGNLQYTSASLGLSASF